MTEKMSMEKKEKERVRERTLRKFVYHTIKMYEIKRPKGF